MAEENTVNPVPASPETKSAGVRPITVKAPSVRVVPSGKAPAVHPTTQPTVSAPPVVSAATRLRQQAQQNEGYVPTIRAKPIVQLRPIGAPRTAPVRVAPSAPTVSASNSPKPFSPPSAAPSVSTLTPHPVHSESVPAASTLKPAATQAPIAIPSPGVKNLAKTSTSRISLDSAISASPELPSSDGPKTIKLKRPTDAPIGKITSHLGSDVVSAIANPSGAHPSVTVPSSAADLLSEPETIKAKSVPSVASSGGLHRTVEVPIASDIEEEKPDPATLSRRKTIKVKHRNAASTMGAASESDGAASAATPSETPATPGAAPVVSADAPVVVAKTHWFFPVIGLVAFFVIIALIIVLSAPDKELASMTSWPQNAPAIRLPGMAPIPGR